MKRSFIILPFLLLTLFFSARVQAQQVTYTVRSEGGETVLYYGGEELCRGDLGTLLSYPEEGSRVMLDSVEAGGEIILNTDLVLSGSLKTCDVTVEQGCSLTLDSATLTLDGSLINRGKLTLLGSAVTSTEGVAIVNTGELTLQEGCALKGIGYTVFADRAIKMTAGYGGNELDILYDSSFEEGTVTDILIGEVCPPQLRVYSMEGERQTVTAMADRGAISVYLPYRVEFFDYKGRVDSLDMLEGEPLCLPQNYPPLGFELLGWVREDEPSSAVNEGEAVTGSMRLHADLRLSDPVVTLSDMNTVYDGTAKALRPSTLFHPILDLCSVYISWHRRDGVTVGQGEELRLTEHRESGRYFCRVTITHGGFSCSVDSDTVEVNIAKAQVRILSPLRVDNVVEGEMPRPYLLTDGGEPIFEYSKTPRGVYSSEPPTETGNYFLRARIPESDNRLELITDPVGFSVVADTVIMLSVLTPPTKTQYLTFEDFDPTGLTLSAAYRSGRVVTVDGSLASLRYPTADSFRYGDGWVGLEYMGNAVTVSVSVERRSYGEIPVPDSMTVTYDGGYHTLRLPTDMPKGLDGIALQGRFIGGGVDAGVYSVSFVLSTDSREYITPPPIQCTLTVLPAARELVWHAEGFVYDGSLKLPKATYTDVFGITRYASVEGGAVGATDSASAMAVGEKNYEFINPELTYSIARADYDLSSVRYEVGEPIYDNSKKRILLTGLPEGVTVLFAEGMEGVNAGEYIARPVLSYDKQNYNEPILEPFVWSIAPADYPPSDLAFTDAVFEYDGRERYPILTGSLPRGLDGSEPRTVMSHGAVNVSDGTVTVTLSFLSDSSNYLPPGNMTATVRILPQSAEIVWSGTELFYTGSHLCPTASSEFFDVEIEGGGIGAGKYTVTARSLDPNYAVSNAECTLLIKMAENSFLAPPRVEDHYEGHEPCLEAPSAFGEAVAVFYLDPECTSPAPMPLTAGRYYAVAEVDGTADYSPIRSLAVSFTVMPNLPLSMEVRLLTDSVPAFCESLSDHISVLVSFSDGSQRELSEDCEFTAASPLTVGERTVSVSYGGIVRELTLTVSRASFDTSSLVWQGLEYEYCAELIYPTVIGLPRGLTLAGFVGEASADAGEYSLTPEFVYDGENYLPPSVGSLTLKINRRRITPPRELFGEYDGREHRPTSDDGGYYLLYEGVIKNAGSYILTALPADNNTELTSDEVVYTVRPRPITLSALDVTQYLFEAMPPFEYKITEGSLCYGDELTVEMLAEGERIIILATHPNYLITVEEGLLERKNALSPSLGATLGIGFVIAAFAAVLVVFAAKRHRRAARPVMVSEQRPSSMPSTLDAVDSVKADGLISDNLAATLLRTSGIPVATEGRRTVTVSVAAISAAFARGDRVDINAMKDKGLVPADALRVRVVADGSIDKPLKIRANDFTPTAVKMIALTAGEAIKVKSVAL